MKYTFEDSIVPLLPLLRCPACHGPRCLEIREGAAESNPGRLEIRLSHRHLLCRRCNTRYPVTEDLIPLLWDADVQCVYGQNVPSSAEASSAIEANVAIYDHISDDYNLYTRRDLQIAQRIQNAARRIFSQASAARGEEPLYHLDFGCGPGHVLGWLKGWGFRQIGLDVSLHNLRNARRHTGCLVVCGNACNMPFADETIHLVTESSVLHHIFAWQQAVAESLRICRPPGGIVLDSEPSKEKMAWSPLAVAVFNIRFPVYKALSYVMHDKYIFRNTARARLNLQAELHNQPGLGLPIEELEDLFRGSGFNLEIIPSPSPELSSRAQPDWKSIVLNLLSARNPWNPKYGLFTAIAAAGERASGY